jgi:hypothetical protein
MRSGVAAGLQGAPHNQCVCVCVCVTQRALVHFQGFAARHDVWLPVDSSRELAHLPRATPILVQFYHIYIQTHTYTHTYAHTHTHTHMHIGFHHDACC